MAAKARPATSAAPRSKTKSWVSAPASTARPARIKVVSSHETRPEENPPADLSVAEADLLRNSARRTGGLCSAAVGSGHRGCWFGARGGGPDRLGRLVRRGRAVLPRLPALRHFQSAGQCRER